MKKNIFLRVGNLKKGFFMKKTFSLASLLAVAVFVGQAWATVCEDGGSPVFCQWDTGCYSIDDAYGEGTCVKGKCDVCVANCIKDGSLFTGVTGLDSTNQYGKGLKCKNQSGTWTGKGKNPDAVALGCCKWSTETDCWTIWEGIDPEDNKDGAEKVEDCQVGSNVFWNGQCPTTSTGACPTGKPVYDGASKEALGCCKWDTQSVCYTITEDKPDDVDDCKSGDNKFWNIGKCPNEGGDCPTSNPDYGGEVQPIIKLSLTATSNIVKAIRNGVNVQLIGNAKIQIYDLKGKMARSMELSQGSYNVELSNMPRGIYIVKVSGLSWKQTITVPVK
ncbi:MAG: T9SS type A sorting domain-containing protein [Candidatus Fibromonas sp.]|nr:T9SS type A sorting domain-containing protein [Candidatus Fibromonas sp.]